MDNNLNSSENEEARKILSSVKENNLQNGLIISKEIKEEMNENCVNPKQVRFV